MKPPFSAGRQRQWAEFDLALAELRAKAATLYESYPENEAPTTLGALRGRVEALNGWYLAARAEACGEALENNVDRPIWPPK